MPLFDTTSFAHGRAHYEGRIHEIILNQKPKKDGGGTSLEIEFFYALAFTR